MKNLFFSLFLILVVLSGSSCRSRRTAAYVPGTIVEISDSILHIPVADTFRLGKLRHGEKVVKEIAVRNTGNVPLVVSDIDSDCGCIVMQYDKKPLMPEESLPLTLSFDSSGYRGYVLKRIKILTTLGPESLSVFLEATVE